MSLTICLPSNNRSWRDEVASPRPKHNSRENVSEILRHLPNVNVHLKPYSTKKTQERSICIILMNQDLRLIPRFRMLGKPLGKSLNFPQCAMVGSMCEGL